MIEKLKIADLRIYAHNGSAAVALELARRLQDRVQRIVLDAAFFVNEEERIHFSSYAPTVEPIWDGSHWLRAWNHIRDSELWWPWFERTHRNARKGEPRIAPAQLTLRVREAMKQPLSYRAAWEAALSYPWRERIKGLEKKVVFIASPQDAFAHLTPDAVKVEDNPKAKAAAING